MKQTSQPASRRLPLLGVDTGGTFTDFVLFEPACPSAAGSTGKTGTGNAGGLRVHKVLSTPAAPEQAILRGIQELGLSHGHYRLVHGSTVATNAVLEGKGVDTVWVANIGMADLLSIGRQAREALYELQPAKHPPPVPASRCLEVAGRINAQGEQIEALSDQQIDELLDAIEALAPRAVAIGHLFSWLNDSVERRLQTAIQQRFGDSLMVCRSSQVLPVTGEYERGIATWLNAWTGPLMRDYLHRLAAGVDNASLSVMQSSGETVDASVASGLAVHLLLSGPAGGMKAAAWIGAQIDRPRLLTFDMGGTSTDVSLIDGDLRLTSEGRVGRYPVCVPMVDIHTIGAGGGSIAWCDQGGSLQVGPESAGADPGPACYGCGGRQATVSDANLVLGRLLADDFLDGQMTLDRHAAQCAIDELARHLRLSPEQTAEGIIRVANEHMAAALRVISVQRGIDPRNYSLMSFGGAGGLHVCALAEALGVSEAIVPVQAGVLSALGMLAATPGRQYTHALTGRLQDMDEADIGAAVARLQQQGESELRAEGSVLAGEPVESEIFVDLRYQGQLYALEVSWQGIEQSIRAFEAEHQRLYGHALPMAVEITALRVSVRVAAQPMVLAALDQEREAARTEAASVRHVHLAGHDAPVAVYKRPALRAGQRLQGPALITEAVSTTWVAPGWRLCVDEYGNLLLSR